MEEVKARSRLAYRVIGLLLALLIGIYFVFQIPHLMLLFLLTLLFAIVLSGPVNYLAQMGLPRGLGVFVVLVSLGLALWLASRVIIPYNRGPGQPVRDGVPGSAGPSSGPRLEFAKHLRPRIWDENGFPKSV